MPRLCVNIDHVATVRQARMCPEPDPVRAAHEAELGGADGVTVHLREDRRHIQDADVERLAGFVRVKLNLEMAATDAMLTFAERVGPHVCMLVPEGRQEVTTEGGLDVAAEPGRMAQVVARIKAVRRDRDGAEPLVFASAFIDAEPEQVDACAHAGFDVCELHTGPYAHTFAAAGGDFRNPALQRELARLTAAAERITAKGMRCNAGHGLDYHNVGPVAALPGVEELHIGHAIVSRAIYVGLRGAVAAMKTLIG